MPNTKPMTPATAAEVRALLEYLGHRWTAGQVPDDAVRAAAALDTSAAEVAADLSVLPARFHDRAEALELEQLEAAEELELEQLEAGQDEEVPA